MAAAAIPDCDLENLLSPMLAAAPLAVVSFPALFSGTAVGFLASAARVLTVTLPSPRPAVPSGVWDRTTHGIRNYIPTPRTTGRITFRTGAHGLTLGFGECLTQTPTGRLLRRCAQTEDRPTIFAAHACRLITYPLAG